MGPLAAAVAGVVTGLVLATLGHPIVGVVILGVTFLWTGLVRAVVPPRGLPLLSARGRAGDVAFLVGIGGAILLLILSLRGTYNAG